MGQYTSYYLYQKYESRGGQTPTPCSPNVYSIDGDGTMPKVVRMENDPECGYVPPPTEPIYRWYQVPITEDYVCARCETPPTPTGETKFNAIYSGEITREVECNDNLTLTSNETRPFGYEASAMTTAVVGYCVTSIGDRAFDGCSSLSSCTIGNNVTSIGSYAFTDCSGLTSIGGVGSGASVEIPNSVTSLGLQYTFSNCIGLTNVTISDYITNIGYHTFEHCIGLTTCNIGSGVTSIGNAVFAECSSLTSIEIPSGVTAIGDRAFYGCSSLTSIEIPSGVTRLDSYALSSCSGLTSITINAFTPPTLGDGVFNNTNDCPIYVPEQCVDTYKTTSGWSSYASRIQGSSGFYTKWKATYNNGETSLRECDSTSAITIGEIYLYRLVSVEIGDCVTNLGNSAFTQCTSLSSCTIGNNVTSIGNNAFAQCDNLSSCTIGNNVTSIGSYGFSGCTSITSINIPNSVTTIGDRAFNRCSSLTSISIPNSVTNLGSSTFAGCSSLERCTIGNGITSIGESCFSSCRSLTSCTIGNNVTSIGIGAFAYCSGLTSIGGVGSGASVEMPNSVTSIEFDSFDGCSSLTSIEIPSGVTNIGVAAFVDCTSLTSITVNATTPPSLGVDAFYGSNCPIYVPANSVSTYKSASGWSTYASRIQAIP